MRVFNVTGNWGQRLDSPHPASRIKFAQYFHLYNNCHLEFLSPVSGMVTKISEKEKQTFFFSF